MSVPVHIFRGSLYARLARIASTKFAFDLRPFCNLIGPPTGVPGRQVTTGSSDTLLATDANHKSGNTGASDVIRTRDLLITNQLLYQLSYAG